MLWLAQQILKAYREEGLVTAEIFGPMGVGKTTYALKVMKEVYKELGYEDPWDMALKMTFFDIKDSLPVLLKAKRVPVLAFDDAGIWLDKYAWYEEEKRGFVRLYKMIRSLTAGILFTTPSPEDILKGVRDKTWFKIKIVRNGKTGNTPKAIAKLFRYKIEKKNNDLKPVVKEIALDFFTVRLPDPVYQRYKKLRMEKGIKPQLEEIVKYFPEVKEKLEEEEGIEEDSL